MRLSDKLDFAKLEPFKIVRVLGLIIYKLNLLNSIRITRIRYILILELADPKASLMEDIPDINPESQKKVWEIEKIIDLGLINNNERKYLIK